MNIRGGSWKICKRRMRERFKGKGVEIEILRSTFLCELTGLDAQLTGLFWQVSDGPYYHFTAGPLGPCITARATTALAKLEKREVKWQESLRRKKIPTLDHFSAAHWICILPKPGHLLCVFWGHVCCGRGVTDSRRWYCILVLCSLEVRWKKNCEENMKLMFT